MPYAPLSALIIARNEGSMLGKCLETVTWCKEIIVIDNGSIDDTSSIAEKYGAKVIHVQHSSFAQLRNKAQKVATQEWLFYIDADERVTPVLAQEILVSIETQQHHVLSLRRQNICYGQHLHAGGWQHDVVERIFHKSYLEKWQGNIHETPCYKGTAHLLSSPLMHLTHRNTSSGLAKSAEWTLQEATLLNSAGISPVTFTTIVRKGFMEFFRRAILKQGYKDGMVGVIEALVQGMNRCFVYIQVWEHQQLPPIDKKYLTIEENISNLWKKNPPDTLIYPKNQ